MKLGRIIGFLSVFTVTACATLSREECIRGDWFAVGLNDGRSGEMMGRLDEHRKACIEYGIYIDDKSYFAGREQGLRDYCQLDNAFRAGLNGYPYRHVCPQEIDGLFARYHAAAFVVHEDREELDRLESELSGRERALYDKKLSDKDRARIRQHIRELDRRRERLRDDLYYHERRMDELRREAGYYR